MGLCVVCEDCLEVGIVHVREVHTGIYPQLPKGIGADALLRMSCK